MILRLFGAVLAAFLMLVAMASSAVRKDRPGWGPMVKVDAANSGVAPISAFATQEKDEALAEAWLQGPVPPDPAACIGGFTADNVLPDLQVRFLDGSEAGATAEDMDPCPFFGRYLGNKGLWGCVGFYARSKEGLLVYDRAQSRWGWVDRRFSEVSEDFETECLRRVMDWRDEAAHAGIQDGGDVLAPHGLFRVAQVAALLPGKWGTPDERAQPIGSLPRRSPIWPLAVCGDYLYVVPGEISARDEQLRIDNGLFTSGRSYRRQYLTWHPRRPAWIRWREDGPVAGSKRMFISWSS